MKKALPVFALLIIVLSSFTFKAEIAAYYISFNKASRLKKSAPERLPEGADKTRALATANGEKSITILDGYRVLYFNKKKAPFVNMKVELCNSATYATDQANLLANLQYLNANSEGMESKDLTELTYNGYKVYGLSRADIDKGNILGTFIMFPGDNTVVYFYFNNLTPEYRHFENVGEYKGFRNDFIGEYTAHLKNCIGK
jgi:hypothetical protein